MNNVNENDDINKLSNNISRLMHACDSLFPDVFIDIDGHLYVGHSLILTYCYPILFHSSQRSSSLKTYYHLKLNNLNWFYFEEIHKFIYKNSLPSFDHFLPILETALQLGFIDFAQNWYKLYTQSLVCRHDEQILQYYLCKRYNWAALEHKRPFADVICKKSELEPISHEIEHIQRRMRALPTVSRPLYPIAFYDKRSPHRRN